MFYEVPILEGQTPILRREGDSLRCIVKFGEDGWFDTVKDHHKALLQFLKSAFSDTEFYEMLYAGPEQFKPFATSIRFAQVEKKQNVLRVKMPIEIQLSTDYKRLFEQFVAAVSRINYAYELSPDSVVRVTKIQTVPDSVVLVRKIKARTISPILLRRNGIKRDLNFQNVYIVPGSEGFAHKLNNNVRSRMSILRGVQAGHVSLEPIEGRSVVVPFYESYVRGYAGTFYLHGEPDTLSFCANNGIGIKTGAGFGLFEFA